MAAEKMVIALQYIVKKELKRGFLAWQLELKQEERKRIYDSYIKFQGLRYLSKAIKKLYLFFIFPQIITNYMLPTYHLTIERSIVEFVKGIIIPYPSSA